MKDPLLEPWRWRAFQELNGLDAQCLIEAKDGTIWFGTADGLCSFDGFEWTRRREDATPANDVPCGGVSTVCSGPDGSLIAGGWWGISQLIGGKWVRLIPTWETRFPEVRRVVTASDGSLWAATSWGVLHGVKSSWTIYTDGKYFNRLRQDPGFRAVRIELLPDSLLARSRAGSFSTNRTDVIEVSTDRQGRIWFGTKGGEILCYQPSDASATNASADGTWTLYNESDGLASGNVPAILPTQDGAIWVVHALADRASVFDGKSWRTLPIPSPGVAPEGAKLLQTRDGVIWLSVRYALLAYREGQWRVYQRPEVPLPIARNLLAQTSDGALWIAGPSGEIQRVDYQTEHWYTLQDLNFQWESPSGAQWFLHRDGRVVFHEADQWMSFGTEDGLIDTPVTLFGTRKGEVWVAGSHEHVAATARFDGKKWTRFVHNNFSWGVDWRAVFESRDGSLWFGAAVDSSGPKNHCDGLLQFRDGSWILHHQPGRAPAGTDVDNPATLLPPGHRPEPIEKFYSIGQSRDGKIWAGRNILASYDGKKWEEVFPSADFRFGIVEWILTSREGDLWLGTRQYGALRYDGRAWRQFQGKDSLAANTVCCMVQTADGSIWAATDRGASRFDGNTWAADVLPEQLSIPYESGSLKPSASGALWINRSSPEWNRRGWAKAARPAPDAEFWTICYRFKGTPPRTTIVSGAKKVSPPGNLSVFWSGVAPWRDPKQAHLQFSYRLDNGPWSAYTSDLGYSFFTLPSGKHHLEVRARDQEFNVDPHPATLDFEVLPPVWRQTWFVSLMLIFTGLVVAQTLRVFRERGHLRKVNRYLEVEIDERQRAQENLRKLNLELDERVKERTAQLEHANKELESFSYSVSHDLRAPLRAIDGFSRALIEDVSDKLDGESRENLDRIRNASQRMGHLIDDMLTLSRINRGQLKFANVDLSAIASDIADELRKLEPQRKAEFLIQSGLRTQGDTHLLRTVLENLVGNAWKFSGRQPVTRIEFGCAALNGESVFFVRDNGVGFDMAYAHKLFGTFERLHNVNDFPGTGIGLATVQRVIRRHGGRTWAESRPGAGATFYFTLPNQPKEL